MTYQAIKKSFAEEIDEIKAAGLWKTERVISSQQKNDITLESGLNVVNMCANNYLGLSSHPEVIQASKDALDSHGYGMSSVRFISFGATLIKARILYAISLYFSLSSISAFDLLLSKSILTRLIMCMATNSSNSFRALYSASE